MGRIEVAFSLALSTGKTSAGVGGPYCKATVLPCGVSYHEITRGIRAFYTVVSLLE